jgi:hypothetical protein
MPEISAASEIVFNSANASTAFFGNTRVWRSPIYIKNGQTATVPQEVYQSNFTGSDLAASGLYSQGGLNGNWMLDTNNDYVAGVSTGSNPRSGLFSTNTWSNENGFTLNAAWRNTATMTRFSVGLVVSSYATTGSSDPFNQSSSGAYGIGFSTAGEFAGQLVFNNGTTITSLSSAQGNETIGVAQTLEITVTDGGWSYSLNGTAPTTGSFTFNLRNRAYRFAAWAQNLPNSTISNVKITGLPVYGTGRENVALGNGGSFLIITPDGYLRNLGTSGGQYSEGVVPTAYRGQNLVKKVWPGSDQSFLLTTDNLLYGWGSSFGGVTQIPTSLKTAPGNNLRHLCPISGSHAVAIKSDGRAVGWTSFSSGFPHLSVINAGGAATSGTGNWTNLKKIVASEGTNVLGLRTDGSIVASFAFDGTHPTTGIKDIHSNYWRLVILDNTGTAYTVFKRHDTLGTMPPEGSGITDLWSNTTNSNDHYWRQNGVIGGGASQLSAEVLSVASSVTEIYNNRSWACAAVPIDSRKSQLLFWGGLRNTVTSDNVQNTGVQDDAQAPRDIYTWWSPYDINTAVWLDPTDTRYLSFASTYKLTTISDRKNSGMSLTQPTDANRPQSSIQTLSLVPNAIINLNRSIWFDTSTKALLARVSGLDRNILNLEFGTPYTQETVFAVIRKNQDTTSNSCLLQETSIGGNLSGRNIFWTANNKLYVDFGTNAANTQINRLIVDNFFTGAYPELFILSITMNTNPTGTNPGFSVWVNGSLRATGSALSGAVCMAGGATVLGNNGGGAFLNGTLGELVMLNYIPVEEVRQKIEGYLAWKFQITSSLPSDHPFKNNQPLRT